LQNAVKAVRLFYPPFNPKQQRLCFIGGTVSENSGGLGQRLQLRHKTSAPNWKRYCYQEKYFGQAQRKQNSTGYTLH